MATILIDSNILIAYLNNNHVNHSEVKNAINFENSKFLLTTTSLIECLVKAYEQGYEFAMNYELTFWQLIHSTVDLTQNIARKSAEILAFQNVSFADAIIWATAEFHGLILWTLDKRLANKSTNIRYLLAE